MIENEALFCKIIKCMGKSSPVEVRIESLILFRHLVVRCQVLLLIRLSFIKSWGFVPSISFYVYCFYLFFFSFAIVKLKISSSPQLKKNLSGSTIKM